MSACIVSVIYQIENKIKKKKKELRQPKRYVSLALLRYCSVSLRRGGVEAH